MKETYSYNDKELSARVDALRAIIFDRALKAYIKTFGGQQNVADSERLAGILTDCSYSVTDNPAEADLIILNTCAVRELAERKALSLIGTFKQYKKKNPELIIGIVGCMGSSDTTVKLIKEDFHYVSFTLGAGAVYEVPGILADILTNGGRAFTKVSAIAPIVEDMPIVRGSAHSAYVSIMYGCNNFCSYCIVPYTRGRERSRKSECIIEECRQLITDGVKEITLLGQNVNSYKSDMDFPELISAIADIPGEFVLRFMTSHPKDVSDRLIGVMAQKRDKIAPSFHLPLQSGSTQILRKMRRTYTKEGFIKTALSLREAIPDIALTTDVIVGYPTESESDFLDTLDVLSRVEFDAVYAFNYSKRAGTAAAALDDDVSPEKKRERITKLLSMQDGISVRKNAAYLGKEFRALVEGESKVAGMYTARTDTNKLVHIPSAEQYIGQFVKIKITETGAYDLFGEIINK